MKLSQKTLLFLNKIFITEENDFYESEDGLLIIISIYKPLMISDEAELDELKNKKLELIKSSSFSQSDRKKLLNDINVRIKHVTQSFNINKTSYENAKSKLQKTYTGPLPLDKYINSHLIEKFNIHNNSIEAYLSKIENEIRDIVKKMEKEIKLKPKSKEKNSSLIFLNNQLQKLKEIKVEHLKDIEDTRKLIDTIQSS